MVPLSSFFRKCDESDKAISAVGKLVAILVGAFDLKDTTAMTLAIDNSIRRSSKQGILWLMTKPLVVTTKA